MAIYARAPFARMELSSDPNSVGLANTPTFCPTPRGGAGLQWLARRSCGSETAVPRPGTTAGLGCDCARRGMGSLGLFDTGADITGWGSTEWIVLAAAGAAVWWFWTGQSGKRAEIREAKQQYVRKVQSIRQRYSTRGRTEALGKRVRKYVPKVSMGI
jgi:hypothetical protein